MSTLLPYKKPYFSSDKLCTKLHSDGLTISNLSDAKKILERSSYYRFKAYLIPFRNEATRKYYPEATFEQAHQLYLFDQDLRLLVFKLIQKIEIALRSSFDYWITGQSNNSFWYLDSSLFSEKSQHIQTISGVSTSFRNSKEEFALHYKSKYYNEFCPFHRGLPPGWVSIELMTFGNLKKLLEAFNEEAVNRLKLDRYASKVAGVKNFEILLNWVAVIHSVRNLCCHHSRLFNRNLLAPKLIKSLLLPSIPLVKVTGSNKDQLNRTYTSFAVIQKMLSAFGFEKIGADIERVFLTYPISQKFMASMGFPERWREETLFF
ncbi:MULTISPECIES: Abi family protein [unclassified Enterobacter cloacae complex]|uniref:Abi family protein n=2 Tax=Enterobacter cloacae complex TaxID=354276 RepID=UPI001010B24F|nr:MULTISPECIES: Abi family protein [unclassified Enterobacter cloacae complex]RYA46044.1 CAAX protease [Enterobacter cloacae complex sp. 3DZ3S2B]RYA96534.1 CAAX protease [Enterobacter cloacae complex sp. 742-ADZ3-9B]